MRLSFSRPLTQTTLDEVVSGQTCEPISLSDFEGYLLHKQHSVEYMQFIVWFQSYRQRSSALPGHLQRLSPPLALVTTEDERKGHEFKMPTPARLTRYVFRASASTGAAIVAASSFESRNGLRATTTRSSTVTHAPPISMSSGPSTVAPHGRLDPSQQPFRVECTSEAHTFLIPSHSHVFEIADVQTLDIPSILLSTVLQNLTRTTHPTVFQPIYDLAYTTLMTSSLPYFLDDAARNKLCNINVEKALYW